MCKEIMDNLKNFGRKLTMPQKSKANSKTEKLNNQSEEHMDGFKSRLVTTEERFHKLEVRSAEKIQIKVW